MVGGFGFGREIQGGIEESLKQAPKTEQIGGKREEICAASIFSTVVTDS